MHQWISEGGYYLANAECMQPSSSGSAACALKTGIAVELLVLRYNSRLIFNH